MKSSKLRSVYDNQGAYYGAVNIVEQAIAMGIKKIIYTSTSATLVNRKLVPQVCRTTTTTLNQAESKVPYAADTIGPDSWGTVVPPEKIDISPEGPGGMVVYHLAKLAAEKKLWEIADSHPEVDFTAGRHLSSFHPSTCGTI
jgi:nucleoside-diphosphate-sugar epimerase